MPALFIQRERLFVAATKDDFMSDTDGLVASHEASNVVLIHNFIELADDIAGNVSGRPCTGDVDKASHCVMHHKN